MHSSAWGIASQFCAYGYPTDSQLPPGASVALDQHAHCVPALSSGTIAELEKSALASRSFSARIGDSIAAHAGKMWFIICHAIWFAVWIGLNVSGKSGFDPSPFPLLNAIVSLEAIFLSLFILMSQNRSAVQADQRNHLELQINLLAEDENTKMLEMLQALCAYHKLNISSDPEIRAMTKKTEIHDVLSELKDNLPGEE